MLLNSSTDSQVVCYLFSGLFDGTIGILSYGAIALVLWYGGKLVNEGHLSPGILTGKSLIWKTLAR